MTSKESKGDNFDVLNFIKKLNSSYKINGVSDLDKINQWKILNNLFIPADHPDFSVWVNKMSPSYKADLLDSLGEAVILLSNNFGGNFQEILTQILGSLYVNQNMRLMLRTEAEKLKFEEIEDRVLNNIESFLLNSDRVENSFSEDWQDDILALIEHSNDNLKKDPRLVKKIGVIRGKIDKKSKEGCYIATACYGSYSSPEVLILRRYRDDILSKNFFGRKVIELYYKISPRLADKLINHKKLNGQVRLILNLIVKRIENRCMKK
jgi:hypothetical protein